jgi:glucokinase
MHIGIDIGGTKIAAGAVKGGKVVRSIVVPTHKERGKAHVLGTLRRIVADLSAGKSIRIGIGVPGSHSGTHIGTLPNLAALDGVDLGRALRPHSVALANDATCFTLAEARYGAGKGKKRIVGITLGTGLGSGVVEDGKMLLHPELGEIIIDVRARRFAHGHDDWESLLCGRAIVAAHRKRAGTERFPSAIWRSQSKAALATQHETSRALAIFCANAVRTFDPDMIVLGGGVATAKLARQANALLPRYGVPKMLKHSALGRDAGIIGAALLVA